jgi:hypothetical protein
VRKAYADIGIMWIMPWLVLCRIASPDIKQREICGGGTRHNQCACYPPPAYLSHSYAPCSFSQPLRRSPADRCESLILFGRCSSSSSRPTASCRGSATSASRAAIPRTKRTVTYVPNETPGTPFSTLFSVVRLMDARSAIRATGMRRRRRASRISRPNFRRARITGMGVADIGGALITSKLIDVKTLSVYYNER